MNEKPHILIGTPCYGGNCHADFVHSLMGIIQAQQAGLLDYSLMTITNESLITRARNTIISTFFHNKNFTHLFFIDSDLGFPKELLPTMLKQNKSVIGCPVPLKGFDKNNNSVFNVGKVFEEKSNNVYTVEHVGTALFMLDRFSAENLCNNSEKYYPSSLSRGLKQEDTQFDVFNVGVKNGVYLSEDYYVCHKLRDLGFDIHIQNGFSIKHNGNYTFQS